MTEQEIVAELLDGYGWSRSVRTGSLRITAPLAELDEREEQLIDELVADDAWSNITGPGDVATLERAT